jgi:ribose transport system permease protein
MRDLSGVIRTLSPRRISLLYLMALVLLVFSITIPDLFLSSVTMQGVASSQAVVGILALGVLLPFVAGEFDITVGANMALSVVVICWLSNEHPGIGIVGICLIAVFLCGLVGLANALLVVKFGVNSFIATLAMSQVLVAIALNLSDNQQVLAAVPPKFVELGLGTTVGVPNPLFCTLGLAVVLWYLLQWTKLGRHLFASGFNREAARLSGVRTDLLVSGSFVASGVICGVAGVVYVSQVGTFSNSIGAPLLFPAFAAVFLGATQFNYRPNVWGTLLAIFTLALGVQGLQLSSTSGGFWITPMFYGSALLAAVLFSRRQSVRQASSEGEAADEVVEPNLIEPALVEPALVGPSSRHATQAPAKPSK